MSGANTRIELNEAKVLLKIEWFYTTFFKIERNRSNTSADKYFLALFLYSNALHYIKIQSVLTTLSCTEVVIELKFKSSKFAKQMVNFRIFLAIFIDNFPMS